MSEPTTGDVHKPFTDDGVTYCGWDGNEGCGYVWPCPTVRADGSVDPMAEETTVSEPTTDCMCGHLRSGHWPSGCQWCGCPSFRASSETTMSDPMAEETTVSEPTTDCMCGHLRSGHWPSGCQWCGCPSFRASSETTMSDPMAGAATEEELDDQCPHVCLKPDGHEGPHFYGYLMGPWSQAALVEEAAS